MPAASQPTSDFKGDWRSIRMFGSPTGSDWTAPFLAGVANCAADQKALYFPYGTYTIASGAVVNASLRCYGEGWGSVIKFAGGITRPSGATGGVSAPVFLFERSASDMWVTLEDLVIDGNNGGLLNQGLVQLLKVSNFRLSRLWVKNGGVAAESGANGVDGISVASADSGIPCAGVISDCFIENTTKAAINWSANCFKGEIRANRIRNCSGNGYTPGIQLNDGGEVSIVDNDIEATQGSGIFAAAGAFAKLPTRRIVISGNRIKGTGTGVNDGHGIHVVNGQSGDLTDCRFIVAQNHVWNVGNASGSNNFGIYVENVANGTISENHCHDNQMGGIGIQNSYPESGKTDYLTRRLQIINNQCDANSRRTPGTWHGITVLNGRNIWIDGNFCNDDQTTKTQGFGVYISSSLAAATSNIVLGTNFCDTNRDGATFVSSSVLDSVSVSIDNSSTKSGLRFRTAGGSGNAFDWLMYSRPETTGAAESGKLIIRDVNNSLNAVEISLGGAGVKIVPLLTTLSAVLENTSADSYLELKGTTRRFQWAVSNSTGALRLANITNGTTPLVVDKDAPSSCITLNASGAISLFSALATTQGGTGSSYADFAALVAAIKAALGLTISDISGLTAALAGKAATGTYTTSTASGHTHTVTI